VDEVPGLQSVTEELYEHPPAEFVARRTELARWARSAGDPVLARQISELRRPSVGAWYLNTAARSGLGSVRELIHLGQQLRDAQAAGDFAALRELAARRSPLVAAVVRDLVAELARLGTTASAAGLDEVRGTLASALADPEVAAQLGRGRLDRAHRYSGFGEPSVRATVSTLAPDRPGASPAPVDEPAEAIRRARRQAQSELADARADLAASAADRAAAEDREGAGRARVEALAAELAEARAQLSVAQADLAVAVEREGAAAHRVEQAREHLDSTLAG
jgi:hypothetical protein